MAVYLYLYRWWWRWFVERDEVLVVLMRREWRDESREGGLEGERGGIAQGRKRVDDVKGERKGRCPGREPIHDHNTHLCVSYSITTYCLHTVPSASTSPHKAPSTPWYPLHPQPARPPPHPHTLHSALQLALTQYQPAGSRPPTQIPSSLRYLASIVIPSWHAQLPHVFCASAASHHMSSVLYLALHIAINPVTRRVVYRPLGWGWRVFCCVYLSI